MKVCIFGTFDARHHPRVQVLEEGLRAHGFDVVRCNVPWRASTEERVRASRRPDLAIRLLLRLLVAWFRLWRRARRTPRMDLVLVGYLGVLDVHLARRCFPESLIALDHLAPIGGTLEDRGTKGIAGRLARLADRRAVRWSDLVVVDTVEHARSLEGERVVVVPVGAPAAWFDAVTEPPPPPPLQVVFFGLYTPLQGTPVIAEALAMALDRGAELSADLVGHGQELPVSRDKLRGRTAIRWHRWVDPKDLPGFVAGHHVCLGIFGTTSKAARVVPNKVFQGAAAGCAILTSDTEPQRRALGAAGLYVPAGDAGALAEVLVELASDPLQLSRARRAAGEVAQGAFRPSQAVTALVERVRELGAAEG